VDAEEASLLRLINAYRAANNASRPCCNPRRYCRVATYLGVDNAARRVSTLVDGRQRMMLERFPDCG